MHAGDGLIISDHLNSDEVACAYIRGFYTHGSMPWM